MDKLNCIRVEEGLIAQNKNGLPLLISTMKNNSTRALQLIGGGANVRIRDNKGRTPLLFAARNGMFGVVQCLVELGTDINVQDTHGYTPLHAALRSGNVELADFLIVNKANVRIADIDGYTPLHMAAMAGSQKALKTILECGRGVDINVQNTRGYTAIHTALIMEMWHAAFFLVEKGANVCIANIEGLTPLHLAAMVGYRNLMKSILEHGADIHAKDAGGNTPLHLAAHKGSEGVKLLLDWEASVDILNINGEKPKHCSLNEHIKQAFRHHSDKLMYVSTFQQDSRTPENCSQFQEDCFKELRRMTEARHGVYSVFSVLLNIPDPEFVNLDIIANDIHCGKSKYPIYHELLSRRFCKAKQRLGMLNEVYNYSTLYAVLPQNMEWQVISYLSDIDLKNIINTVQETSCIC